MGWLAPRERARSREHSLVVSVSTEFEAGTPDSWEHLVMSPRLFTAVLLLGFLLAQNVLIRERSRPASRRSSQASPS